MGLAAAASAAAAAAAADDDDDAPAERLAALFREAAPRSALFDETSAVLEALDTGAALPETRCAGALAPTLNPNPNPNPKPQP